MVSGLALLTVLFTTPQALGLTWPCPFGPVTESYRSLSPLGPVPEIHKKNTNDVLTKKRRKTQTNFNWHKIHL